MTNDSAWVEVSTDSYGRRGLGTQIQLDSVAKSRDEKWALVRLPRLTSEEGHSIFLDPDFQSTIVDVGGADVGALFSIARVRCGNVREQRAGCLLRRIGSTHANPPAWVAPGVIVRKTVELPDVARGFSRYTGEAQIIPTIGHSRVAFSRAARPFRFTSTARWAARFFFE